MCCNVGAVSVISGLALFIGKLWVMSVAGIGGYYYMQGQYDDKVTAHTLFTASTYHAVHARPLKWLENENSTV